MKDNRVRETHLCIPLKSSISRVSRDVPKFNTVLIIAYHYPKIKKGFINVNEISFDIFE